MGGMSLLAAFEMDGRGGMLGTRSPLGGWGAGRTGARGVNVLSVIGGLEGAPEPRSGIHCTVTLKFHVQWRHTEFQK